MLPLALLVVQQILRHRSSNIVVRRGRQQVLEGVRRQSRRSERVTNTVIVEQAGGGLGQQRCVMHAHGPQGAAT